MQPEQLFITQEEEGERLDKILAKRFEGHFSRTYFQALIEQDLVSVNEEAVKKRERLKEGDEVEVHFTPLPGSHLEPENIPLDILFEDEAIVIINKPAGLVVHPAPGNWTGTLVNALLYHTLTPSEDRSLRPGIVHRLDKETSGVILTAKTALAQQRLVEQFHDRHIEKVYALIAEGVPSALSIDAPIGRDLRDRKKMAIREGGKSALTRFELVAKEGGLSFLYAYPFTGRTHQIRLHAKALGAPILGDTLYHKASKLVGRQMLHAFKLTFTHPLSGLKMTVEAPFPEDFASIWKKGVH